MTEQPISTRLRFSTWLRTLLSGAPSKPKATSRQSQKLPRMADMLANIGRESGPER
ncbi:MAG: hypothetical protein K2P70_02725 [Hyphomonadaceae bacterium]|nr:hypothetical protein [Hyphomonadaceae bacterium]